jgi:hypothetical protein
MLFAAVHDPLALSDLTRSAVEVKGTRQMDIEGYANIDVE